MHTRCRCVHVNRPAKGSERFVKAAVHVRAIEAALLRLKAQQADEKEKLPLSASLPRSSSYDVFFPFLLNALVFKYYQLLTFMFL